MTFRDLIESKLSYGDESMYFMGSINQLKQIIKKESPLDIKTVKDNKIYKVYSFDGTYFYDKKGNTLFDIDFSDIQLRGKSSIHNSKPVSTNRF